MRRVLLELQVEWTKNAESKDRIKNGRSRISRIERMMHTFEAIMLLLLWIQVISITF